MEFTEELKKAREIMVCTFASLDLIELGEEVSLEFEIRFTACMGKSNFLKKRIRLSQSLWEIATKEDRYQTIVHEVCHIANRFYNGFDVKSHGKEWKNFMIKCGVKPLRCHSVDNKSLKPFKVKCSCMFHRISSIKYNKILKGTVYKCDWCKEKLKIENYAEK